MNIYDIAKLSGVSIATVSRVVNGSDKVSDKTRQRVLSVIEEAGYTPNVFAQGLGLNTMHTVGILVPDISDLYMSSAVSFLESRLHAGGYEVILSCSSFDPDRKQSHVQMLLSKKIDALILVGSTYAGNGASSQQTEYIREAAKEIPVFVINGIVEGNNIFCTVCDDFQAIYDVTSALIARGRRRILFMSDSQSYSAQQKMAGYEKALSDGGLPVLGDLRLRVAHNRIHYVRDILLQYQNLTFDSVVATEDAMAVGVIKYAAVKGLKIPEDLAVTGYNNSVVAVASEPELTSVDSRLEQMCDDTVKGVIGLLQDHTAPAPTTTVRAALVKRSTTDF